MPYEQVLILKYAAQKSNDYPEPFIVVGIKVVYDFKKAIENEMRKTIRYAKVPHVFQFTRAPQCNNQCCMSYKLFSGHGRFMGSPAGVDVAPGDFSFVGGEERFKAYIGLDPESLKSAQSSSKVLGTLVAFNSLIGSEVFRDIEEKSNKCMEVAALAMDGHHVGYDLLDIINIPDDDDAKSIDNIDINSRTFLSADLKETNQYDNNDDEDADSCINEKKSAGEQLLFIFCVLSNFFPLC